MAQTMDKMIRKYGNGMYLAHNGKKTMVRAFLQETQSRSQGGAEWERSPLGQVPKGVYVYIGPADPAAVVGDDLHYRQAVYQLRRAHLVVVEGKPQYCWGICVEKGGDGTWGE